MELTERALKRVFVGPTGLRNGWRFAIFAALWYVSGDVVTYLLSQVYTFSSTGFTPTDIAVFKLGDALYLLLVSLLLVRLERHRPSWFGLSVNRESLKLTWAGCVWGFAFITLLILILWLSHCVTFEGLALHRADFWKYLAIWLVAMLLVGLDEELQFRGYGLAALTRGIGFWPAALALATAFALDHLAKPLETVADIFNIGLLGLFTAYSVRRTGSLWFAIGFHASFDFFAVSWYASPNTGNSGTPLEHHLLQTHIAGPPWLTGGPQGLEASWLVPPLVAGMFWLLSRRYPRNRYPHD